MGERVEVTFLGRPGCHLCDEALAELEAHLETRPEGSPRVAVKEVNIETDDELHRRYLERIPVIMVDQQIISEIWFEADAFEQALEGQTGEPG